MEASSFSDAFPMPADVPGPPAPLAGWWWRGKGHPCFTWWAVGRPAEHMECAKLLNVMSVDCVGRPMQRSTINLSQMPSVTGFFISHHCVLGLVFSCQQTLERSSP